MTIKDQPITSGTIVDVEPTLAGQVMPVATQVAPRAERLAWLRRLLRNRKAAFGGSILLFFLLVAVFAPVIAPGNPSNFVARPGQPPSREHIFGTTGQGQDVFMQTVHGARISLGFGFAIGLTITAVGAI